MSEKNIEGVSEGYKENIRRLAKERKNEIVYNSNAEYAVVVLNVK